MQGHSNSPMPGEWNPSWAASTFGSVTASTRIHSATGGSTPVALDDQVQGAAEAEQDPERQEQIRTRGAVDQPADAAPGDHAGEQDPDDGPGGVAALAVVSALIFVVRIASHARRNIAVGRFPALDSTCRIESHARRNIPVQGERQSCKPQLLPSSPITTSGIRARDAMRSSAMR